MRRQLLVLVAISAAVTAAPPTVSEARSLLGLLTSPFRAHGVRHHGHHRYHYHRGRPARSARALEANPRVEQGRAVAVPIGAFYWARAYDDLVGYTFGLGNNSKDQFWSHGFKDVLAGMIPPPQPGRPSLRRHAAAENLEATTKEVCLPSNAQGEGGATSFGTIAFKQIEQAAVPTSEQRGVFDDLRVAMIKADQRMNSGCALPYESASPPERLKAINDRLWALRQAMLILRTPLEAAYNALDDQQKARFNGRGSVAKITCVGDTADLSWPRDQIEQAIQPSDDQRASLESLRLISLQMGQAVDYSCPRQPLTGPVQRLDAAGDRLNTLLYATMIISRTLNTLYASLTDEQKASFRAVGRSLRQGRQNSRAADAMTGRTPK